MYLLEAFLSVHQQEQSGENIFVAGFLSLFSVNQLTHVNSFIKPPIQIGSVRIPAGTFTNQFNSILYFQNEISNSNLELCLHYDSSRK